MHLLVVAGVRSGAYRVGWTQDGPETGERTQKVDLKGSPSLGVQSTFDGMRVNYTLQISQCNSKVLG